MMHEQCSQTENINELKTEYKIIRSLLENIVTNIDKLTNYVNGSPNDIKHLLVEMNKHEIEVDKLIAVHTATDLELKLLTQQVDILIKRYESQKNSLWVLFIAIIGVIGQLVSGLIK